MKNAAIFGLMVEETKDNLNSVNGDLLEILKVAMESTHTHWLMTDEDEQFQAAIAAVMLYYGEDREEYKRLKWEVEQIRKAVALVNAIQVGLSISLDSSFGENSKFSPIGLSKLWAEIKKGK